MQWFKRLLNWYITQFQFILMVFMCHPSGMIYRVMHDPSLFFNHARSRNQTKKGQFQIFWILNIVKKTYQTSNETSLHLCSSPPLPITGTVSPQEQSNCRVPPKLVYQHVGSKCMGAFFFAIYPQYSPVFSLVGCFTQCSGKKSSRITF